jgi:hypothetical protein
MSDETYGLRRDRRGWDDGQPEGSAGVCPLCDGPATVKELRALDGPVFRLLVLCDSCSIYRLTTSAEWVLRRHPNGRAVLADRVRRTFASTGLPMEVDVETVERVAQFFGD